VIALGTSHELKGIGVRRVVASRGAIMEDMKYTATGTDSFGCGMPAMQQAR